MVSVPPLDLVTSFLSFAVLLFLAFIACEWLKDDMKIIYQFIILIFDGAILLLLGVYLYLGIDNSGSTYTDPYFAAVLFFFGGILALLSFVKLLYRPGDQPGVALQPYGQGSEFPARHRKPERPGGGF